jgi:hypothetical protein
MPVGARSARSDGLVVEELDDELLIYDRKYHRAHCLSVTAARVWRALDGATDAERLAAMLELSIETVVAALEELDRVELLEAKAVLVLDGAGNGDGLTRRQLAKLGTAAAAGWMIVSITVPSAAWAASPTPFFCSLYSTSSCGGGNQGCGSIAGCCCCCQKGGGLVPPSCKLCSSSSFCMGGMQTCPDGSTGRCSNVGSGMAGSVGGCCSHFPNVGNLCGCAFGGAAGCCDALTLGPCTSSVNCVPCCTTGTPKLITQTSPYGCCQTTTNTC